MCLEYMYRMCLEYTYRYESSTGMNIEYMYNYVCLEYIHVYICAFYGVHLLAFDTHTLFDIEEIGWFVSINLRSKKNGTSPKLYTKWQSPQNTESSLLHYIKCNLIHCLRERASPSSLHLVSTL